MKTNAAANIKMNATTYFERLHVVFALTKRKLDDSIPVIHNTNAVAKGNAACMHGYVARLGFGITRIRNQINAVRPIKNKITDLRLFLEKECLLKEFLSCSMALSFKVFYLFVHIIELFYNLIIFLV